MPEQLREDLEAVRELLASEKNWTKGMERRIGRDGMPDQYCLVGAAKHVVRSVDNTGESVVEALMNDVPFISVNGEDPVEGLARFQRLRFLLDAISLEIDPAGYAGYPTSASGIGIPSWNDNQSRQHSDVVDLLDRAIKRSVSEVVSDDGATE